MAIDLYYSLANPVCRTVLLVAKALGVELNLKPTSVWKNEHKTPEFLKINPQHCIPTLVDNGFVLWESRAILGYLVNQYGKDDTLYPKDPDKRSIIDQRLYFDIGTLSPRLKLYMMPFRDGNIPDQDTIIKLEEAFDLMDKFLEDHDWIAGDEITIADFALVMTVSFSEVMKYDISRHHNLSVWFSRTKKTIVGFDEITEAGNAQIRKMMSSLSFGHKRK